MSFKLIMMNLNIKQTEKKKQVKKIYITKTYNFKQKMKKKAQLNYSFPLII